MKWLLVIMVVNHSGGVHTNTVPYQNKSDCEVASLGVWIMDKSDDEITIYSKCVIGSELSE